MSQKVRPGDVFKLICKFPHETKPKFLTLAKIKPYRFFIINSEVNEFIHNSAESLACQIDIPYEDHRTFLTHDSVADCLNVVDTYSVIADSQVVFNNLYDHRVGRLQDYVISQITYALNHDNVTIKTKDKKVIVEQLNAEL